VAKDEQQGYHQGHKKSVDVFRKVLMTLAPSFGVQGYFEAYL